MEVSSLRLCIPFEEGLTSKPFVHVSFYGFRVNCFLTTYSGSWVREEAPHILPRYRLQEIRRCQKSTEYNLIRKLPFQLSSVRSLKTSRRAFRSNRLPRPTRSPRSKTRTLLRSPPSGSGPKTFKLSWWLRAHRAAAASRRPRIASYCDRGQYSIRTGPSMSSSQHPRAHPLPIVGWIP